MEFADLEEARLDGSVVTLKEGVLDGVSIVCSGSQFNLWAVFFYLFITIALVCIVIAVLKVFVLKGNKKEVQPQVMPQQAVESQQEVESQQAVEPEQEIAQPEAPAFRFCGNCGTKCETGAAFCPECGTKF